MSQASRTVACALPDMRGSKRTPRPGAHELFAFLTTEANEVVRPIHPKAMPVILTSREEVETWLTVDWREAKALQRPLPADLLEIVERPAVQAGWGKMVRQANRSQGLPCR